VDELVQGRASTLQAATNVSSSFFLQAADIGYVRQFICIQKNKCS
jgi:hypothetical protein